MQRLDRAQAFGQYFPRHTPAGRGFGVGKKESFMFVPHRRAVYRLRNVTPTH